MIKVLLADDHKMVREALTLLLEDAGDIQVVATATDGAEAVEMAKQVSTDVAVIDISMPCMDGIAATLYIHQLCPNTAITILSLHDTPEYVERALQAGALGYILKEAAGAELVEAVHTLAEGKPYFSPEIAEHVEQVLKRDDDEDDFLTNP